MIVSMCICDGLLICFLSFPWADWACDWSGIATGRWGLFRFDWSCGRFRNLSPSMLLGMQMW
ncbi:hypothetical protein KC19_2G221700 [Ceratodon purpureus]|uniref:Uncharacterized protein n=1 Tax=Ceratodon purpureus TaxID=3225 RepID=A0A8T0IY96_CERPU|nr:hypothetical protein KC19_2G221700 [Ceratodon purpureus]